jgi:hypothetical protein
VRILTIISVLVGEYTDGSVGIAKAEQKSLSELDDFRYQDAVKLFSTQSPKRAMNHDDVKTLLEWKL